MRVLIACTAIADAYSERMKRVEYKAGESVGSLVFVRDAAPLRSASRVSRCAFFRCKCGKEFSTLIASVVSGNTRSCGCFIDLTPRSERKASHHLRQHPIYRVWCSMKTRCTNPRRTDYPFYGGSGIRVSQEFSNDFKAFYDYVTGLDNYENRERDKLTLDRTRNAGNYQRGNLRWITRKGQANNRRNNVKA